MKSEIIHVKNRDEKRQLRVAYNSVFRKIFGYRWSESVTALQGFLSRPTWEELVEKRQSSFFARTANHHLANALSSMWLTFSWSHVNQRQKKKQRLTMVTRLCGLLRRKEPHLFSFCFWYRLNTIVRLSGRIGHFLTRIWLSMKGLMAFYLYLCLFWSRSLS